MELPCPSSTCTFKTVKLEYAQAQEQLELHARIDHSAAIAGGGGESQRRPEKFHRPEISIDKSMEIGTNSWLPGNNIKKNMNWKVLN